MAAVSTKLTYESVYGEDGNATPLALAILYQHLEARTPEQNISHKEMPQWSFHVGFVNSKPFKEWWIVYETWEMGEGPDWVVEHLPIGQIYLSKNNAIGISFQELHRRKGYAEQAVQWLIERVKTGPFYANIAPGNEASIALFSKLGFTLLQQTYILSPKFYDQPNGSEDEPRRMTGGARFDEAPFL